jgi:hypothetical protein
MAARLVAAPQRGSQKPKNLATSLAKQRSHYRRSNVYYLSQTARKTAPPNAAILISLTLCPVVPTTFLNIPYSHLPPYPPTLTYPSKLYQLNILSNVATQSLTALTFSITFSSCLCFLVFPHVNVLNTNLLFCWPCVTVYQYSETNVMQFLFSLLRINP